MGTARRKSSVNRSIAESPVSRPVGRGPLTSRVPSASCWSDDLGLPRRGAARPGHPGSRTWGTTWAGGTAQGGGTGRPAGSPRRGPPPVGRCRGCRRSPEHDPGPSDHGLAGCGQRSTPRRGCARPAGPRADSSFFSWVDNVGWLIGGTPSSRPKWRWSQSLTGSIRSEIIRGWMDLRGCGSGGCAERRRGPAPMAITICLNGTVVQCRAANTPGTDVRAVVVDHDLASRRQPRRRPRATR